MSIYGEKKDYEELIHEKIQIAKALCALSDEDKREVELLLKQKEKIRNKNGFFATFQINRINKKIEKIQSKY